MTQTLYKKLEHFDQPEASELDYVMEKHIALTLVAARVRLGRCFPIIGVPDWLDRPTMC